MIERVEFNNSRNGKLVGDYFKVSLNKITDAVIIMCHGFTSDRKSKGRFERLSKGFNEAGFDALAFDFSGCGESSGEKLTMENETDDLSSAIKFVKSLGYKKIALYGHSLGSLICFESLYAGNSYACFERSFDGFNDVRLGRILFKRTNGFFERTWIFYSTGK